MATSITAVAVRFLFRLVCQFYWQLFRRLLLQRLSTCKGLASSRCLLYVSWSFARATLDLLRHRHERLLDVGGVLCGRLQERHVEVSGELFSFFARHLPPAFIVDFVAYQHLADVIIRVLLDLWDPCSHVVKRLAIVHRVNDNYTLRAWHQVKLIISPYLGSSLQSVFGSALGRPCPRFTAWWFVRLTWLFWVSAHSSANYELTKSTPIVLKKFSLNEFSFFC